jgi:hypothetical protein
VYYGKAAKFWNMNPAALRTHPDCEEITAQAWDLMQIENKAEKIAFEISKNKSDFNKNE